MSKERTRRPITLYLNKKLLKALDLSAKKHDWSLSRYIEHKLQESLWPEKKHLPLQSRTGVLN